MIWKTFWDANFAGPLGRVEEEMREFINSPAGNRLDFKTMAVLVTAAVALTLHEYSKGPSDWRRIPDFIQWLGFSSTAERFENWLILWDSTRIDRLTWWVCSSIVGYILIPIFVVKVVFRESLVDYGIGFDSTFVGWRLYALMAAFMLPIVWLVSTDSSFQQKYPFYPLLPGEKIPADFLRWELLYAFQFIGLEFFFRGFLLHGLRHRFGTGAIFVMMVPYCMIHFRKPMPESFAAIIAGIVLGAMSLKTRSIWLGAALHVAVAWTMDSMSLWRKGFLFGGGR